MSAETRIVARSPGFLHSRNASSSNAGAALLHVLGHFAELVGASLARVHEKQRLAFLDMMGVSLLEPTAARAPLVFTLADDAPVDVPLPAGTEVAAPPTPVLPTSVQDGAVDEAPAGEPIIFTTERSISLARASLDALVSVVPADDAYAMHALPFVPGSALFDDLIQIPHELYLGHDTLFELPASATVSIQVSVAGRPAAAVVLKWEYATNDGWLGFEPTIDQTHGLTVDGEIVLRKVCGPTASKATINGIDSYWIRARVVERLAVHSADEVVTPLPRVERMRARVALGDLVPLDAAYADGMKLDSTKDFWPFGFTPDVGTVFAIACKKAFDRQGAAISLHYAHARTITAIAGASTTIVWEYSTGPNEWRPLPPITENFTNRAATSISFGRPDDWAEVSLNGERSRWLRARIAGGGYRTVAAGGVPPTYTPPVLAGMTAEYQVQTGPTVLDHCFAKNRFDYSDHTDACIWGRDPFQPFRPVPDETSAVYFGFRSALPLGLVSLFVAVPHETDATAPTEPSGWTWEYETEQGWFELPALDETNGFRRSGMVELIGQPDHVPNAGPSKSLHWVRARRSIASPTLEPLALNGVYVNGAWARDLRIVRGEVLGQSDGSPRLTFRLQHGDALANPRVEVQEWHGVGRDWESLFKDLCAEDVRYERDGLDRVVAVWTRWHERPTLHGSAPSARHYTVERRGTPGLKAALVRFGDGVAGMVPPTGATVAVTYTFGGGQRGNLPAGAIRQSYSAVPYIASVTNPIPSSGGAEVESIGKVADRGRQQLRHRGRAIGASDYEWLAHDASAEVARARCLATTGPGGSWPGFVTIVIAPASNAPRPRPSPELMRRVRHHLAACSPAAIANNVIVTGAAYQPISVVASVVIVEASAAAAVEERLRRTIDDFLHPLTGRDGAGWEFGATVHLSSVARLIESVDGVDLANEIQLRTQEAVRSDRVRVPADRLPASGRHVLRLRVEA